jgi:hypothetical protein
MPRDGLRLYVYVLPNYGVNPAMLEALLAFHDCLYATTKADLPGEVALLLLPFKLDGYQRKVDLDLSYQILRAIPSERARKPGEVYVVGANGPIDPHAEARGTIIEIRVGGVGPEHIGVWLARLQQMVERDHTIGSPRRLDLRISSILTKVTSKGELIWHFKTAVAAPFRCR